MERSHHFEGLLILLLLAALGGIYLWQNHQPDIKSSVPVVSSNPSNGSMPDNQQLTFDAALAAERTIIPTTDFEDSQYVAPTLPPTPEVMATIIEPQQIQSSPWPTMTPRPTVLRPTHPGPTLLPSPTGFFVAQNTQVANYQPPPEEVPLSPHAYDHFWFVRPADASANSESLFNYPFGSNGPQNDWRVHAGIDLPNPVGEKVYAGGAGTVIYADDARSVIPSTDLDVYSSYGNCVLIEYDYGYRGQHIWLLYAHMATLLVEKGQHVEQGDVIGLSGGTGDVSGPHVHMEVRMGTNSYFSVYNPLLWIAPWTGYGVVAGSVTRSDGSWVEDVTVTLSQRGRIKQTTTTYIGVWKPNLRTWNVQADPARQENFVLGDVPEGDYVISVTVEGKRLEQEITVAAGTTNFVNLGLPIAATPQPVED
ncbi:MAG TPA: M23 family metallopeptidase [Aggregatilineaceae bacterium]|nr:M23 family metallopeptidase [Aggregatilineaceae bacterium]